MPLTPGSFNPQSPHFGALPFFLMWRYRSLPPGVLMTRTLFDLVLYLHPKCQLYASSEYFVLQRRRIHRRWWYSSQDMEFLRLSPALFEKFVSDRAPMQPKIGVPRHQELTYVNLVEGILTGIQRYRWRSRQGRGSSRRLNIAVRCVGASC